MKYLMLLTLSFLNPLILLSYQLKHRFILWLILVIKIYGKNYIGIPEPNTKILESYKTSEIDYLKLMKELLKHERPRLEKELAYFGGQAP